MESGNHYRCQLSSLAWEQEEVCWKILKISMLTPSAPGIITTFHRCDNYIISVGVQLFLSNFRTRPEGLCNNNKQIILDQTRRKIKPWSRHAPSGWWRCLCPCGDMGHGVTRSRSWSLVDCLPGHRQQTCACVGGHGSWENWAPSLIKCIMFIYKTQ